MQSTQKRSIPREGYHLGPRAPQHRPLNERAWRVLRFLRDYHAEHTWMPTIREISEGCGITATSVTSSYLDRLERDGYLVRERNQPRCIRFTLKGVEAVEAHV